MAIVFRWRDIKQSHIKLTVSDMPATRYGPSEADMEEVVKGRINHLAKTHSQFLQSVPVRVINTYTSPFSGVCQEFLQATFLKGHY